jgi:hypothetical protein
MKFKIIVLISLGLLSACQSQPPMSAQDILRMRIDSALRNRASCESQAQSSPLYKVISKEIIFSDMYPADKYALLANPSRLSDRQKSLLKDGLPVFTQCKGILIEAFDGLSFENPYKKYFDLVDTVYVRLLKNELTIEQANRSKELFLEDLSDELKKLNTH